MIIIVMGVSGSGKTTVGRLLAGRLGWDFHDGDDLHPLENVFKMASGVPLTDDDRRPWLETIGQVMRASDEAGREAVIACSALRKAYRDYLMVQSPVVRLVYLRGDRDTILARMKSRSDHFMPADLLDSQFEVLEEPKDAIVADISKSPEEIVELIVPQLGRAD